MFYQKSVTVIKHETFIQISLKHNSSPMDFKVSLPEENLTIGFTICPEVKNSHLLVVRTQTINGYIT